MKTLPRLVFSMVASVSLLAAWTPSSAEIGGLLKKCTICHGENGISAESAYPSIAGIPVDVQVDAMHGYREGTRDCGPVMEMCRISENLTDEQILELSEYFAAFAFARAKQEYDPELAAVGAHLHEDYCEVCHGDSPDHADRSILHGQWMDYLRYSLNQYKIGARKQPPSMRRQTEKLSADDIEALINFYASYGSEEEVAPADK